MALSDVSPGDIITSSRANEINDRLEQGTGSVNTSELTSVGSVIGVNGSFSIGITAGSVIIPTGGKIYFEGAGGDTYIVYNSGLNVLEVYRDGQKRIEF